MTTERARRITIAAGDDVDEFLFDQGLTDGLPVVPPTPERVERMLAQTRRDPLEEMAVLPPNLAPLTVEKVAINAVMAGCKPEYFPTVLAGVEAIADEQFALHGVGATTMGGSPVLIVNGPVRERIGVNCAQNALGQGHRANATIGRAVRLVIRNVAGHRPGGTERATIGWPGKYTMCFGEWEERAPTWRPLHVERAFDPGDSVITAITQSGGPSQLIDESSRSAKALAGSIGLKVRGNSTRASRHGGRWWWWCRRSTTTPWPPTAGARTTCAAAFRRSAGGRCATWWRTIGWADSRRFGWRSSPLPAAAPHPRRRRRGPSRRDGRPHPEVPGRRDDPHRRGGGRRREVHVDLRSPGGHGLRQQEDRRSGLNGAMLREADPRRPNLRAAAGNGERR